MFARSAIIALAGLATLSGCLEPTTGLSGVQVWGLPESTTIFPDALPEPENEVFSEAAKTVRLEAAIHETVSFQLALRGGTTGGAVLDVSLSDLRQGGAVIPADRVRVFREECIAVSDYPAWFLRLTPDLRTAREYPDVLVPIGSARSGRPLPIPPGRTVAFWVDVHVPPGTAPGPYLGTLRIAGPRGPAREFQVLLSVWPFALPQTRHLSVVAGLSSTELLRQHIDVGGQPYAPPRLSFDDPAYERAVGVLDAAVRLLHEHRCTPVLTDVYPLARMSAQGRPELEWADYDRLVSGLLDGTLFEDRAPVTAWPIPVNDRHPPPDAYGGWGTAAHKQAIAEYLAQSVAHFKEKGWFDRHYVWMPPPEGEPAKRYDAFDALGRLLLSVEPRLNVVCALPPQPMRPYGVLKDGHRDVSTLVGTWCPPAEVADPAELQRRQAAGQHVWFTPNRPPFAGSLNVLAPPLHARSLPWTAFRMSCAAIFLPEANRWSGPAATADRSEAALIWPGKPYGLLQPLPSIRLKRLRRGLQDYEYLWLLEQNRRPGIARLIAGDLVAFSGTQAYGEHCLDGRPGGWITDPAAWTLARRLMARELLAAFDEDKRPADRPPAEEDLAGFEQQVEWSRLTEATRGLRVEVEGVRVDVDPKDAQTPLRVEATLTLFNAAREPFSGLLGFSGVPGDWKVEDARLRVEKLESRRWARRVLSAKVPSLPTNADGVLGIDVTTGTNATARTAPARICALTSQPLGRAIVLDGKLDDWPLGQVNMAADFVLVGALDAPKRGRNSADRASQQTVVFVCNDASYLYIGFNCADDRMNERVVSRGNAVRYDELWPTGEDLVEVVLDPTHRAVDAGDLLHFVVKANGAVISERGVPCLADVARYSDWPAGVEAAVDDTLHKDRWTVEMRIPLKALTGKPGVWGANFGRYQARLGEYSSWSGARRHLYSPAALGNLLVND